jgi:sodium transport system ATP-binding protein
VHDPQHVLLDEPTNGLDVVATRHLRDWLRELRKQGRCVLLSSYVMQEVEALVDDLVIIAAGRVTLTDSPAELAQRYPGRTLEEIFVEAVSGAAPAPSVP